MFFDYVEVIKEKVATALKQAILVVYQTTCHAASLLKTFLTESLEKTCSCRRFTTEAGWEQDGKFRNLEDKSHMYWLDSTV